MIRNKIISGDYKGSELRAAKDGLSIVGTNIVINSKTVTNYEELENDSEIVQQRKNKSGFARHISEPICSVFRGMTNTDVYPIRIEFDDGKKSVIEITEHLYKIFKSNI